MPAYIKLSELAHSIEDVFNQSFSGKSFWVIAETININNYPARRNCYLKLVEKEEGKNTVITSIDAVIWGGRYAIIEKFENATLQQFKDNIQLLLQVKVSYHITFGLKLEIIDIDHSFTIGKLEMQRQQVLQMLVEKNDFISLINGEYITKNKTLAFNPVIQNIALISSPLSDGHNDFVNEIEKNKFGYQFNVMLYESQVQGMHASEQIKQRLIEIYKAETKYDAVVIVRGGGSQINFSAFDNYELARAVAKFPVPIITGIGHEKNECITDLMACLKTKTPTKAAASIIAHNRAFEEKVLNLQKRVIMKTKVMVSAHAMNLQQLNYEIINTTKDLLEHHRNIMQPLQNIIIQKTNRALEANKFNIEIYKHRLADVCNNYYKSNQFNLEKLTVSLRLLSPENILKRGYAIVYQDGKIVKDFTQLNKGDVIKTVTSASEISSTVNENPKPRENNEFNL